MSAQVREDFKYYFANFVRKGGGGTPQIRNPLFAEKKSVKGGRREPPKSVTYFLDQNQVFFGQIFFFLALFEEFFSVKGRRGLAPKSVTYFLDQKQVFFEQKTPFLALFEGKFSGKSP